MYSGADVSIWWRIENANVLQKNWRVRIMKNCGLKFVLAANMGLLLVATGCSQTEKT